MPSKNREIHLLERSFVFALALLVCFVVVFGVGCIIAYNSYIKTTNNTLLSIQTRANLLAGLILEHQRAAIGVLRSYASRPLLVGSVKTKNFDGVVEHLADLVKNNPEMEWPFVSDPDGTVWVNFPVDRRVMNKNLSERDWHKGVSRGWKPYVSSVYKMIVGEQDLATAVSVPIFDAKGKVIGILGTSQSTAFFQKIISEVVADLNTGISLIDKEGHIIYSNRVPYKKEVIGYSSFELVRKAMKGKRDVVEIRDSSNRDMTKYVSFEPVEGIGWSVIVEKEKGEVFQSEFVYVIQLGIISFLVFMGFAFSLLYLKQKHKQMRSLRESGSRLQLLTSQLLTAQENERKRIAHELHDSIGASLGAIKFKIEDVIEQMEPGTVIPNSLKGLVPLIQEAVRESRRIMADLRPSVLDDLGVLAAINWHCREFENTYSHIRIQKEIEISEDKVPISLRTPIYRIIQEALNNIAKHSKADLVTLSLRKTGDPIELSIWDNGQGFNVEETLSKESSQRGFGLSSMRERVELMGGSFSIESGKGIGTVIRATWPIE